MVKITYICDRCKKEWDSKNYTEQPVIIGIALSFNSTTLNYNPQYNHNIIDNKMWCRTCVMSFGITYPSTKEDKIVAPTEQPSFEEKLKEILLNIGVAFNE